MSKESPQRKSRIRAVRMLIDRGAQRYDGNRHLDRLLGGHAQVWKEAASDSGAVIARLKRALRSQRQLGRAGHWSYDLNRHFGLLQALKAERARSRNDRGSAGSSPQPAAAADASPPNSTTPGISETGTETS